ncbi:MAG: TIGR04141 family sporadically distributed protein [Actinobacteria bacterium]|nr:TIGR04141 family sporadically distributed protein [Actinomycetota bacterium]
MASRDLPAFTHESEAAYNQDAAQVLGAWCLDRANLSPSGSTQIEPCDIARLREDGTLELIHVKIGTASTTLSHAFNQGANSAVLLRDSEPQAALLSLLNTTDEISAAVAEALKARKVLVTFAIVTHRPEERRSANLPLFSQISLDRQIRTLSRADIDARFVFIPDLTNKSGVPRKDLKAKLNG